MFAEPFNEGCRGEDHTDAKSPDETSADVDQVKDGDTTAADAGPKHPAQQPRRGGLAYHSGSRSYRFL